MATQHLKLHPLTGNTDHDVTGLSSGQIVYVQNPTTGVQSTGLYADGSGGLTATTASITTLSAGTMISGSTNLYSIFAPFGTISGVETVGQGSNVLTGGTAVNPTVSVVASPSFNNVTFSGAAIGGNVQAATVTATSLSAATLSGGTILSGSTNLYAIFATAGSGVQAVQPGSNITTGGTLSLPVINLAASPSVNGLTVSGTANVTGVLQSGGTDLNAIYVQGSGTVGTVPLWSGTKTIGNSVITQNGTGVTVNGSIQIYGNVDVLGTATTFNTQTIQTSDNNITMNLSGSHVSALYGGITVLSGTPNNVSSTWTIDANGTWSANTAIITSAITVNGGDVAVTGGGAITSGGTNLYNIFAAAGSGVQAVQPGTNTTTGGTLSFPTVSVVASPSFNNVTFSGAAIGGNVQAATVMATSLSAGTLSGGTILSGSTNLYAIFATAGSGVQAVQPGTNTTTGGTLALPTVNVVASPSFNNITFSGAAIGGNVQAAAVTATSLSATTLSGGTILSGSTNLYNIFLTTAQSGTSASLWSASTGSSSIIANNGSGNLASGAFSIVGGKNNSGTSAYSTVVGGWNNLSSAFFTAIVNGYGNNVTAEYSTIGNGYDNRIDAQRSFIGSGVKNRITATANKAFIGSGQENSATTAYAIVVGGRQNTSSGNRSALVGGQLNKASSAFSFIGAGYKNSATTKAYATVVGGKGNLASGYASFIGAGINNKSTYYYTFVGAGNANLATGQNSAIISGLYNSAVTGNYTTVINGQDNLATGGYSVIANGIGSRATGLHTFIGSGQYSSATTRHSSVVTGRNNLASGLRYSTVVNGTGNTATGLYSAVINGRGNRATAEHSTVVNGHYNAATGAKSFIGGGLSNSATSSYNIVLGGKQNLASGQYYASVLGGRQNTVSAYNYSTIVGGILNNVTGAGTWFGLVGTGRFNNASGYFSTVLNGESNLASGRFSLVLNGSGNTASGEASAVMAGSGHTISGARSAVIGGFGINGSANDTVYMPNARLAETTGSVIYSAGTDLYNIFASAGSSDVTRVQPGSNITTGGTGNLPVVSVVASPSFNNVTFSGAAIGGNVQAAAVTATSLSATTLSGGTILSGSTNLYSIFLTSGSIVPTYVQPGSNITTGGTATLPIINLAASPSINNLTVSGTANVTGVLQSGGTDLNAIYVQGSGTVGTIPLWSGTKTIGNSVITQNGTGVTVNGSIQIYGNVDVLGTATTFNTQTVSTSDNNITMNLSGSHVSALFGGITVLSGTPNNVSSTWTIDTNGSWSSNTQILTSAITVSNGNINVNGGGALQSGGTNLYSIFATAGSGVQAVQPGTNTTTGGTLSLPTVSVVASPSFNNITFSGTGIGGNVQAAAVTATSLSAGTLSGGTILSGSTNLYSIFQQIGTDVQTAVQPGSNITTGGTLAVPTVSLVASPSVNGFTASGNTSLQGTTGTTIYASQFFAMTPYTGANPAAPTNDQLWMYSGATGIITLNYRVGGVTKTVELS